jgi:hypothetical protein
MGTQRVVNGILAAILGWCLATDYRHDKEFEKLTTRVAALEETNKEQARKLASIDPFWGGEIRTESTAFYLLSRLEQIEARKAESPESVMDDFREQEKALWVCSYLGIGPTTIGLDAEGDRMLERLDALSKAIPTYVKNHPGEKDEAAFWLVNQHPDVVRGTCRKTTAPPSFTLH